MNAESIDGKVAAARAELESTLNAIEDKLNVPKRVGELTERAKASYSTNPVPWLVAAAVATAAVASLIAWAIFSDDD